MKQSRLFRETVLALGLVSAVLNSTAWADRNQDIENFLKRFDQNSKQTMDEAPAMVGSKREKPFQSLPNKKWKKEELLKWEKLIDQRDKIRQKMCKEVNGALVCLDSILPGRASPGSNDLAENLVDLPKEKLVRNLTLMDKSLKEASLDDKSAPWSDDYWPIYRGILGARYATPEFETRFLDWTVYQTAIEKNPMDSILKNGNVSEIDLLSPSEKYDLLTGSDGALTQAMWAQTEEAASQGERNPETGKGKVETWMGICHGWSPASYMFPRPTGIVKVKAADGKTNLIFYPADIKALASLLWAQTRTPTKFIGGRCNEKDTEIKKDANGRVLSANCFDTNPMTWHLSIVNQIGLAKRSFVMDATYDYEVWNQPVYGYSYTYFNPQTGKETNNLKTATVAWKSFTKDKFRKYRKNPSIATIVGVAMDVTYVVEMQPTHDKTNNPADDGHKTVRYLYDLELDAKGTIVGGEWYGNMHPDFLWTPEPGKNAQSVVDMSLSGTWNGTGGIPANWSDTIKSAAENGGQPVYKIVRPLVDQSRSSR